MLNSPDTRLLEAAMFSPRWLVNPPYSAGGADITIRSSNC
jgi:hypothetical protein